MHLPLWTRLNAAYPDYLTHPNSHQVKREIGGSVDAGHLHNTCVIRLSRGLNYAGVQVPNRRANPRTLPGGDGKYYAIRVRDSWQWLMRTFGAPQVSQEKERDEPADLGRFALQQGIIGFRIEFKGATGHLDLWNGAHFSSQFRHNGPRYFDWATEIALWRCPDSHVPPRTLTAEL